ncbi:MAG: sulfate adenylate transferase subunit 1 [Pseudomonadota bacterium]|jgi:sulfate adenylyltransferase subunit 1
MSTVLRITTAGSVDDGKSTLIGRLLYDSKALLQDQLIAVANSKSQRTALVSGTDEDSALPDLSLLTDGLEAEREQGITIDVAYRYLSTGQRKFIIADSPGHEQYTRNMVTAASNSDVAIVLIDVTKLDFAATELALLPQTRRHAMVASLLSLKHLIVAVNKMDALGYQESVFQRVQAAFAAFAAENHLPPVSYIPISALRGDNIVAPSSNMPWYPGPAILPFLEALPLKPAPQQTSSFALAVQTVLRTDAGRYYLGRVTGGSIAKGAAITVSSNGETAQISALFTARGASDSAEVGESIRLQLDREVDISRGDWLLSNPSTSGKTPPIASTRNIDARLTWLSSTPYHPARRYLLRHGTAWTQAQIQAVTQRFDVVAGRESASTDNHIKVNDIVRVRLATQAALPMVAYQEHSALGAFILVDPSTHETLAAGMAL